MGLAFEAGVSIWLSASLAILVAALAGATNGALAAWGRIHPLIVTLAAPSCPSLQLTSVDDASDATGPGRSLIRMLELVVQPFASVTTEV